MLYDTQEGIKSREAMFTHDLWTIGSVYSQSTKDGHYDVENLKDNLEFLLGDVKQLLESKSKLSHE